MVHLKTIYSAKLQLMRTECICLRHNTQRHIMSTSPEASLYLNVWSSSVLSVKKKLIKQVLTPWTGRVAKTNWHCVYKTCRSSFSLVFDFLWHQVPNIRCSLTPSVLLGELCTLRKRKSSFDFINSIFVFQFSFLHANILPHTFALLFIFNFIHF